MQTAQQGDRILVHYVKRLQGGSEISSVGRGPVQVTVGVEHRRLPGLGLALVGLQPGTRTTVHVPPEQAYGLPTPARLHHWPRRRFPQNATLRVGRWVRFTDDHGRRRMVRILGVTDDTVAVDANHPWAGQAMDLEVELISIQAAK